MEKKTNVIGGKEYTYISMDECEDFFCNRCQKHKRSRKHAEYFEGEVKKVICNACYGTICAKKRRNK